MADGNIASHAGSDTPYYVYILRRPDHVASDGRPEPFYVGCGKAFERGRTQRVDQHEGYARQGIRSHRISIICKLWSAGLAVVKEIDSWHGTTSAMFEREIALIVEIGRLDLGTGPLTNKTSGGDGGFDPGPETREKMRQGQLAIRDEKVEWAKKHAARTIPIALAARRERWGRDEEFRQQTLSKMINGQLLSRHVHPELWRDVEEKRLVGTRRWMEEHPEELKRINAMGRAAANQWWDENPELAEIAREKSNSKLRRWKTEHREQVLANAEIGLAAVNQTTRKAAQKKWTAENAEFVNEYRQRGAESCGKKRSEDWTLRRPVMERCRQLVREHGLDVVLPHHNQWTRVWLAFEEAILEMIKGRE